MNHLSLPQCHDARTTTQGAGSARARQPWGGLRWPRGSGHQTSSSQTRRGLRGGSPAAPAWEPDIGNQRVVITLVRKGDEAAGEQET
jgi:hypothetical protein